MTTELFYLLLTALLLASLWIPYIVGVNMHVSASGHPPNGLPDKSAFPLWVRMADRAHGNLVEGFSPFAALVIIAHILGISTALTLWATIAFFWLRLLHALWMIAVLPIFPARPIIFTASWLCTLIIGVQVALHG